MPLKNDSICDLYGNNIWIFQASELLDELLKIFSPSEITANISLLSHSVSHVKIRVAELLALNNPSISPRVLNLSEKKFYQFLDNVKNK